MERQWSRRGFTKAAAIGLPALSLHAAQAAPVRRLKVGHTGITWGYRNDAFEPFGNVLEDWEAQGGMGRLLDEARLPLISAYCGANLSDPAQRGAEVAKLVRWGKIIRKYGGTTVVIGPNFRGRDFDFAAAKPNIVAALNDMCKALADIGVIGVLHQHTGTTVELRDEVYGVLDAVDTRYVKFGPDIGQLAKGGSDPVQVVKDFLPIIRHAHLKDFDGGPHWAAYCPLGKGKVNVPAVLDLLETQQELKIVMVELDPSRNAPLTPVQTAETSKEYLKKLGYSFRS